MKKHEPILKELRAIISMMRGYFVWKDEQRKRERRAMGIISAHDYQQRKNRKLTVSDCCGSDIYPRNTNGVEDEVCGDCGYECLAKEIEAQDKIMRECSAAAIKKQGEE